MSLGCDQGGLGLRSAEIYSLGGYLSSLEAASALIKHRFPLAPASVLAFLRDEWVETFGPLPDSITQRTLSQASDRGLLPRLYRPDCPPAPWMASIQSMQSSCFWCCLPSEWGNSFIDNACFRVLVQLRYRQQVMYAGPCPMLGCPSTLDVWGDHALCCKVGGDATVRHNRLAQRIALECGKAMSGVTLETLAREMLFCRLGGVKPMRWTLLRST